MRTKIVLSFTFFSFVLFVLYLSLNNSSQYETQSLIGNKISSFKLKSLIINKSITNEDLIGNDFTLINFWASWCNPCRVEHKYLLSLSKNQKLKILGINFKDKKNNALSFLEELGDPYNYIAEDPDGKASVIFGIYGIPESILIDKDSKIIRKFIGPISKDDYKIIIKKLNEK
jgi:cytochrome c biogenesis protein CcmG/thiol:disulfide interchange protein DsbE|tara:strand:- start:233 stop:751 length:519 start_codon:yes stop_codon:yes gene_type:complete